MAATLVKTLSMQIVADPGDSRAVLDDISAKGDELRKPIDLVLTADGAEAQAGVDEVTESLKAYLDASERAADAQIELEEKQAGGKASDEELAAAHDKVTEATIRQLDASIRLGEAQERESELSKASADVQEESAAKTDAAADAADDAGGKFGKFGFIAGAALAAVAYESGKLAVGFQSDMEMIHTQAGVAQSALPGLEQGVLKIAGAVGENPDSLAEALYHVESSFASVGIKGPQALNLVKIAAEGAVTGHADLVDVTNALDAAIVSGIPGVQNFGQAMGALNATVGAGDMHMEDLAQAFGTGMLATVKGFGVTLNDVGAALATFGDNNIRGAKAGTELRMAVQALGAPGTGPVAVAALKSLNLSYTQLSDDMQKGGLRLAITDLVKHLKQAGDTGDKTGEILTDAFGKKAGSGINILVSQVGRFQSKFPDMQKGANDFGKDWSAAAATPAVKLKQLESGGEAAATSLGLVLLPALESVLGPAVSFLNWVDSSSVKMQVFAGIVGVVAGTVLIAKLGGAIKGGVKDFQELGSMVQAAGVKLGILTGEQEAQTDATEAATVAQGELDVAMDANPIGAIIMLIVGLIGVIILVVTHLKDFKTWGVDAFHFVQHAGEEAFTWVKGHWPLLAVILLGPVALATLEIVKHWHQIEDGAEDAVHWIEQKFDWLTQKLPGVLEQGGINMVMGLVHGIESVAMAPVNAAESIVGDIRNLLPFSPAKRGPLSGAGSPDIAGRKFATMFADGITAGASDAERAASRMAGGAQTAAGASGGRGGGAGGGDTYNFYVPELNDPIKTARVIQQMLLALKRRNGRANLGLT